MSQTSNPVHRHLASAPHSSALHELHPVESEADGPQPTVDRRGEDIGVLAADRLVFVYGTLRRGGSNDLARWHPDADFVAGATLAGTLYDLGAYPGAVFSGPSGHGLAASSAFPITGEIYRITVEIERALDILEAVEAGGGGEYVKRFVDAEVGTTTMRCLAYEIHPSRIEERPVIVGGDWIAHRIAELRS